MDYITSDKKKPDGQTKTGYERWILKFFDIFFFKS